MTDIASLALKVDTREVKKGSKDLGTFSKSADKAGKSTDSLGKKVTGVKKPVKAANDGINKMSKALRGAATNAAAFEGPLGGVSGRLGAMSTLLTNVNPVLVAMGVSFSALSIFMASAIKEFDQLNVLNQKTAALIKATGSAAGLTAGQLNEMAESVALNTLASVEGIKEAQNVLLTFKGISGDAFSQAIVLSQDMAAVMGGDAKTAALQLGKALESPTTGITALKRSGVSFSAAQREMIKEMESSGRVAEAQELILTTLANQIGGTGAAEGDGTVIGAVDSLSQHWQKLKTNIAGSSGAAQSARDFFQVIGDGLAVLNNDIWPEDDTRLQELTGQLMGLREEHKKLVSGERTGILSFIVGTEDERRNVDRAINSVVKEMKEIQDRRKAELVAQKEAADSAADFALQRTKESAAEKANILEAAENKEAKRKLNKEKQTSLSIIEQLRASTLTEEQIAIEKFEKQKTAIEIAEREKLDIGMSFDDAKRASTQRLENDLSAIRKKAAEEDAKTRRAIMQSQIEMGAQLAGNLAQVAAAGGEDSFKTYKRLAQAQAAMSASVAIMRALADGGPFLGPALAVSIGAVAAVQIGQIDQQQYQGARRFGGAVSGGASGSSVLVGEAGPEILSIPAGMNGHITPNNKMGGDSQNVTIVNQFSPGVARTVKGEILKAMPMILNTVQNAGRR